MNATYHFCSICGKGYGSWYRVNRSLHTLREKLFTSTLHCRNQNREI